MMILSIHSNTFCAITFACDQVEMNDKQIFFEEFVNEVEIAWA